MPISAIINASTRSDLPTPLNPSNDTDITEDIRIWSGNVTLAELKTAYPLSDANHMFVLDSSVYCASDCRLTFSNVQIDFGIHTCFIHPVALPFVIWKDCLLYTAKTRTGGSLTRPPKDMNKGRVTLFNKNGHYNADGGGVVGGQTGSGTFDRIHLTLGDLSNVQIRQSANGDNDIQFCRINKGGTYRNVKVLRVGSINTNGNVNSSDIKLTMHDCEFRSTKVSGTRVGAISNASMILNDCIFGNIADTTPTRGTDENDFMFDQSGSWGAAEHHIYFCGSTSDRWQEDWTGQNANRNMQSHQGGLRYYQLYKEGSPFGGSRHRLYSTLDDGVTETLGHRNSTPIDTTPSMLELSATEHGDTGEFACLTIAKTRKDVSNSWNTTTQTGHFIRIRERSIQFQDVPISDPTLSIGRPDNAVPLVVQPDIHFDSVAAQVTIASARAAITLDFVTKEITLSNGVIFTIASLYSYLKILFTDFANFHHDFPFSFDGDTLRLTGWTLTFQNSSTLFDTNGTRIICETLSPIPSSTSIRPGVEIIDSTGITISISSPAPGARCAVSYTGQATLSIGTLPHTLKIPLDTDYKVTVKAPGYIYETYEYNTSNVSNVDARLAKDPSIDLSITLSSADINSMELLSANNSFFSPLNSGRECEIHVYGVNLYAQLARSKRIVDALFSSSNGLYFLHNYVDELTNAPLQGKAFVFESDRMRIDSTKIDFRRVVLPDERCRIGLPVWTHGDMAYFAPLSTLRRTIGGVTRDWDVGTVNFDSLQAVADIPPDVLASTIETITSNAIYTDTLSKAMWDYLTSRDNPDGSYGKLIKENLDAKISVGQQNHIGRFRIYPTLYVGGGSGNHLLEAGGANIHPNQLFLIRGSSHQEGLYFNVRLDLFDISGESLGAQFVGGDLIDGGATSVFTVLCGVIDENYLYVVIDSTGTNIHRIPLDKDNTETTYAVQALSFDVQGIAVNNNKLVLLRHRTDDNGQIEVWTVNKDFSSSLGLVKTPRTLAPNNHVSDDIGIIKVDTALVIITGSQLTELSSIDYTILSNEALSYRASRILHWHGRIWSIDKENADNHWLMPFTVDREPIYTYNILNEIARNRPNKVWEVSDDMANHTPNSIGSALIDMIVHFDLLTTPPDGKLTNEILGRIISGGISDEKITSISNSVWTRALAMGAPAEVQLHTMLSNFDTLNNNLTGTRISNLDHLDSNISSRVDGTSWNAFRKTFNDELIRKLDNRTVVTLGYIPFKTGTYATGYIRGSHNNEDNIGIINQNMTGGNITGDRIILSNGDVLNRINYVGGYTANRIIMSATSDDTYNYYVMKNTHSGADSDYRIIRHTRGTNNSSAISQFIPGLRCMYNHPVLSLMEIARVTDQIQIRWDVVVDSTSTTYDYYIDTTIGINDKIAVESHNDLFYVLHNNTLYVRRFSPDHTTMEVVSSYDVTGQNLIFMHGILWVYDGDKIYPLDDQYNKVDVKWSVISRKNIQSVVDEIERLIGELDTDVGNIPNYTTEVSNLTTAITTLTANVGSITSIDDTVLSNISIAVRDLADYDDVGGETTSLKETLIALSDAIQLLEDALWLDSVPGQTGETVFKKIKDIEAKTNKLQFNGDDDIKATLDGEKVTLNETLSNTIKTAISESVEEALLDDTDGRAFLDKIKDKVEDAIENESLTTESLATAIKREVWTDITNPDDPEGDQITARQALNTAREHIVESVDGTLRSDVIKVKKLVENTRVYDPEDSTERIKDDDDTDLAIYDIKDDENNPTGSGNKAFKRVKR